MKKTLLLLGATMLFTGCANHLRFETHNDPQKLRSEPKIEYFIKIDGDDIISKPIVKLKIEQIETLTVTESQNITKS